MHKLYGVIIIWNMETAQPTAQPFIGHLRAVASMAFSPDGKMLVSAGGEGTVSFWDMPNHTLISKQQISSLLNTSLSNYSLEVCCVVFSRDGQVLAIGSNHSDSANATVGISGAISLWDPVTQRSVRQISPGPKAFIHGLSFGNDNKTLVADYMNNTIVVWDTDAQRRTGYQLPAYHSDLVTRVIFSPDGQLIASGSRDKSIILWDAHTGQPVGRPLVGQTAVIADLAFSPDGKILASSSLGDKNIILWDVNQQQVLDRIPGGDMGVIGVAFSPDGKLFAAAGDNKNISLWDVATRVKKDQIAVDWTHGTGISFSPDGRFVAAAGMFGGAPSNSVLLQNVATHKTTFLTDTLGASFSLAYSPDGAYIVASNPASGAIVVWDAATHKLISKLNDKNGYLAENVALSKDGKTLAATACANMASTGGCTQSVITLWDMINYKSWGSIPAANTVRAYTLSFSPDGRTLASNGNNAIVLWNVDLAYWQALACHIVNRNLSQDEWNQYLGADLPYEQTCPDQPSAEASALWPQYSTDRLAAGSSISMTAQPSLAPTAEPPLAVAPVAPHIPQTVVTGMPNGLSLAFPALIQCRKSGDSSNLVRDYFGIWAVRVDNKDQWIPQGKAEIVFSSTTTTDVQKYNISFTLAPNELGWLMSEDVAAGKIMKDIPSSSSVLRLAMQDVVWKPASSQISQYRFEVGFMNHSLYGNASYPQHAAILSVHNLGDLGMNKIRLFGIVQNHLGDAVDVLYREGEAALPPGEVGYFLVKSRSASGRCVGAADSQGYILHYWLTFETEDGQPVTRYSTTTIQ